MKKLARIACLVTVLVLSGFASAGAWPEGGYCYYECSSQPVWIFKDDIGQCCGTWHQCPDDTFTWAQWWEQWPYSPYYCWIG